MTFELTPTEIRQKNKDRLVIITWSNGEIMDYSMEYLRVFCPCAACRGHVPSQRQLVHGKRTITIASITQVGQYAIKIAFSDSHDSGVFSWETLHDLGRNKTSYWETYLQELKTAGKSRMSIEIKAL